jgi:hypothetical protein
VKGNPGGRPTKKAGRWERGRGGRGPDLPIRSTPAAAAAAAGRQKKVVRFFSESLTFDDPFIFLVFQARFSGA